MKILERKDGKAIGYENGKLYEGTPKDIPFDQFTEKVTVSKDGKSVNKKVMYGDYLHGEEYLDRDSYIDQNYKRILGDQTGPKAEKLALEMAKAEWEKNLTPQAFKRTGKTLTIPASFDDKSDGELLKLYGEIFSDTTDTPYEVVKGDNGRAIHLERRIKIYDWKEI